MRPPECRSVVGNGGCGRRWQCGADQHRGQDRHEAGVAGCAGCGNGLWSAGCGNGLWSAGCGNGLWSVGCGNGLWSVGCGNGLLSVGCPENGLWSVGRPRGTCLCSAGCGRGDDAESVGGWQKSCLGLAVQLFHVCLRFGGGGRAVVRAWGGGKSWLLTFRIPCADTLS